MDGRKGDLYNVTDIAQHEDVDHTKTSMKTLRKRTPFLVVDDAIIIFTHLLPRPVWTYFSRV